MPDTVLLTHKKAPRNTAVLYEDDMQAVVFTCAIPRYHLVWQDLELRASGLSTCGGLYRASPVGSNEGGHMPVPFFRKLPADNGSMLTLLL